MYFFVPCPSNAPLVRSAGPASAQTLSPGESSYVGSRANIVLPDAWAAYLRNVEASSYAPLPSYVRNILTSRCSKTLPRLGIAVSGGGYRAALFGAGVLSALDGRNTTAASQGTGGLLQTATYLSGSSGGGWLVTALSQANFPTIPDLIFPPSSASSDAPNSSFGGFLAQVDLFAPGATQQESLAYLEVLLAETAAKHQSSGLPITITDMWSRALARHFINGTNAGNILNISAHGAGDLFSGLTELPTFQAYRQPCPILVANTTPPNPNPSETFPEATVPRTSEIWEFNVYESGSFDPSLGSFIPTSLLGSTNASNCMVGLDQASFIIGLSSNRFNSNNVSAISLAASPIAPLISLINATFPSEGVRLDSGAIPNPFKGTHPATYTNTNEDFLTIVDGGSNGEVLPLQSLLVRARNVDTITGIDVAANTPDNFANGTDLIATAIRTALLRPQYAFPEVPSSADVFVQQGLTRRPTFFGCYNPKTPLLIYIANGGPPANGATPLTNTSTLQSAYSPQEVQAFIDQAVQILTSAI